MRFDIYGRFQLQVKREGARWVACRVAEGKRRPAAEVVIPADTPPDGVAACLADLLHEQARPGTAVRRLD